MTINPITLSLTPMEERIMEVFHRIHTHAPTILQDNNCCVATLYGDGRLMYGQDWDGRLSVTSKYRRIHPVINRFLGSLQSKGLVTRSPSGSVYAKYSYWNLTDAGRTYLGIAEG